MKKTLCSLVFFTLLGCGDPAPQELLNDYYLSSTNSSNTYITKGASIVIRSDVVYTEIKGDFIIGKRTFSDYPDHNDRNEDELGYFFINTKTGEIKLGLEEKDLEFIGKVR
ncbi:hypothetical protein [Pseudoalteromonas sp. McH1-42]|uniref:hypothetical protein n=1 Tax=Pseudoalteromonas sp. McH1-42 TaxID=2917752 RepID=UPI001EF519DA|nr:hypothetical protein [Pseudoalteromonas sp. McH1-42]MCG7564628.1 hypothetical protein [Pseudoalteromonas sp. McH1-42]